MWTNKKQLPTHTNLIVFGLNRPWLEPMTYPNRGEHANHYTTDDVAGFEITMFAYIGVYAQLSHQQLRLQNIGLRRIHIHLIKMKY
jgi:hypothetical protein